MSGLDVAVTGATVICNDPLYRCRCVKPAGHVDAGDAVHACGEDVCGGSWEWLDEHRFVARSYPTSAYAGAVMPPPDDVWGRDGEAFVECGPDGQPMGMMRAVRGGIRYILPPEIAP